MVDDRLRIRPLNLPGLPDILEIPGDGLTLGRDPSNQVVLGGDRYPFVSGFHARVLQENDQLVLEDLESRNGTYVNGKRIRRVHLKPGDIIQLGKDAGIRLVVVGSGEIDRTADIPHPLFGNSTIGMSLSKVLRLRKVLGVHSEDERKKEITRAVNRRMLFMVAGMVVVLGGVAAYLILQTGELKELRGFAQEMESRLAAASSQLDSQQEAWEIEKTSLESERTLLLDKLGRLEESGRSSAEEIQTLRSELAETTERLSRYQPASLDDESRARREQLRGVLRAITLIEQQAVFREESGSRYLYADSSGKNTLQNVSRAAGEPYQVTVGTGSGFCVSDEGWILTNAHVVAEPVPPGPMIFNGVKMIMEPTIFVIFSGTSRRHPAKVVKVASESPDDFAVLKIDPFENMPHIETFRTDVELPETGSDVTLFGFPLGFRLPQEEDAFKASIFTGIVSRRVGPYIQVQAAVYPGNSGGPVIDGQARVIGIVTAVQMVDQQQIASDIGFVLPVSNVAKVWPPETRN